MRTLTDLIPPEALDFDPEKLASRYKEERSKRILEDAEAQFVEITNDSPFADKYLIDDPYAEPLERDPIRDETEVIIIGGGWVGMMTAARLHQAGVTDVRFWKRQVTWFVMRSQRTWSWCRTRRMPWVRSWVHLSPIAWHSVQMRVGRR